MRSRNCKSFLFFFDLLSSTKWKSRGNHGGSFANRGIKNFKNSLGRDRVRSKRIFLAGKERSLARSQVMQHRRVSRDRARLSTRTNSTVPSVPIKRHGSVIAEIVRGRYAKRRFRSFIAIENVGQERRMRGKASTFPAIEKKEKFLPVLFFLRAQYSRSMNI